MTKVSVVLLLVLFLPYQASLSQHNHKSDYAGQENREIKSLSAEDIAQLRQGAGWGLAKAAELNGLPGPRHLLDAAIELSLSDSQIASITSIYDEMKARAIIHGELLITREQELESLFRSQHIDETSLRNALSKIAEARKELRFVHLAAHLKTPAILSKEQIESYNALRGYGSNDPCAAIPEGHDPNMWRKHNGCE